ncbi:MAG: ABC transporter permease [Kiritimatiellae bacterium]|nr:ABC transporter permease [Kiritimatiellia bacterium]
MNGAARSLDSRPRVADLAGLLGVLVLMVGLFAIASPRFLNPRTFVTIANQVPDLVVISVGMTLVLVTGGIDLSVGSMMALCASVLGVAMARWGWPAAPAAALAVMVGLAGGMVNGAVSVGAGIPSFIVTLGMLEIARGAAYLVTDSQTQYIGRAIEGLGAPLGGGWISPAVLLALALVTVGQFALSRTVFGRHLVAIGTNETAVRLSGIDPRPPRIAVFALSGLLSGLAGVMQTSRLASADPNSGVGMELAAIAAVVIGGTSLMGGRGSVVNTLLGVLIIAVLQTGLAQVGASEPTKRVITGVVIVAAVLTDALRRRWPELRGARRASRGNIA